MNEGRRQLRNSPYNGGTRQYTGSKEERQKATQKARLKLTAIVAASLIGLGAATPTAIQKLANQINHNENTQMAIEMVDSNKEFFADIEEELLMQTEEGKEQVEQLRILSEAAIKYKELSGKEKRTIEEEQEYINACRTVCDSKDLVIDTYSDIIKSKAAEAYGITDPEEIKSIMVQDFIDNAEFEHFPRITLPDGRTIGTKATFLSSSKDKLDRTISSAIIDARHLRDVNAYYKNRTAESLPVNDIIETFEEAKAFEKKYKFVVNEKGKLVAEEIEQSQDVAMPSRDDDER